MNRGPLTGASARLIVDAAVRLLVEIAAKPGGSRTPSHFDCVCAPEEPLLAYAARLFEHLRCSAECFALALIYINRYLEAAGERLSVTNVHRLLVTGVRLATKFFDDHHRSNRTCAALGGIRTKELNELESQFLQMISWRAYVSEQECEFCMEALRLMASKECNACAESMEALQLMVSVHGLRLMAATVSGASADSGSPGRRRKGAIAEVATPPKQRPHQRGSARRQGAVSPTAAGKATGISPNKVAKVCKEGRKPQGVTVFKRILKGHLKSAGRRVTKLLLDRLGAVRRPFPSRRSAFHRIAAVNGV